MKPTVGRIVDYFPTMYEQEMMSQEGNNPKVLPAIIVAIWNETCVNLKVFTDGRGSDMWATSVYKVDRSNGIPETGQVITEGRWDWPIRVE